MIGCVRRNYLVHYCSCGCAERPLNIGVLLKLFVIFKFKIDFLLLCMTFVLKFHFDGSGKTKKCQNKHFNGTDIVQWERYLLKDFRHIALL